MSAVDFSALPKPVVDDYPDFLTIYNQAWELAASHIVRNKKGREFMDVAWGKPPELFEWVWDSCFVALYCRYAPEQFPGMQSLDNFYELQRQDGYISMTYDMNTGEEPYPDRINPPLFAWAEWEYYLTTGDDSRFARVVPHIERLMEWIDANRRPVQWDKEDDRQLYYFRDCGSSGMDDSPRAPRDPEAGKYFEWVDLSSQMVISFRYLAKMHGVLGNAGCSSHWDSRAERLGKTINSKLWCEKTHFYYDRHISQRWVSTKTAAAFWPLLAGICDEPKKNWLVGHLLDKCEFNQPTPVPSLSADDPNYSKIGEYWVGGVWPSINYMVTRGLRKAGCAGVAHQIALKYLSALARTYTNITPHTLWECQSPEEDKPGITAYTGELVKPDFVGWTGVGPIAMLIENILGLEVSAPKRRIEWTIHLQGRHGIEGFALGKLGKVTLLCGHRDSADAPAKVEIRCEVPMAVVLRCGVRQTVLKVTPGRTVSTSV